MSAFDGAELRRELTDVLEDARDGLLDSIDEGVDRILELTGTAPAEPLRCNRCHKIKGDWRGYMGPQCQCGVRTGHAAAGSHSTGTRA
jgi:hypothetical protein